MTAFTAAELRAEALREVAMRRRAYPGWVRQGRLDEATAGRRIRLMVAIAEGYREPDLFGERGG